MPGSRSQKLRCEALAGVADPMHHLIQREYVPLPRRLDSAGFPQIPARNGAWRYAVFQSRPPAGPMIGAEPCNQAPPCCQVWLSPLAFASGFRLWLSPLAFASGFRLATAFRVIKTSGV